MEKINLSDMDLKELLEEYNRLKNHIEFLNGEIEDKTKYNVMMELLNNEYWIILHIIREISSEVGFISRTAHKVEEENGIKIFSSELFNTHKGLEEAIQELYQ